MPAVSEKNILYVCIYCPKRPGGVNEADECIELVLIKKAKKSVFIGFAVMSRKVIFHLLDFVIAFVNN